jgi:hypothetical protein
VTTTNFHLYKMFDAYKEREGKKGREKKMTFIINVETLNRLMNRVNVCQEGNWFAVCVCVSVFVCVCLCLSVFV